MLRLKYRSTTQVPVEAECLTPDNLAGKSIGEIAALSVQHGNTQAPVGEFFEVEGNAEDRDVLIEGDCSRVKLIGSGMAGGRITIHGNAGMHLGAEMKGGEIHLHGNSGDWVGAEMRGGSIQVHGNAGHTVGAGYRGSQVGMRGGTILVRGNAGTEIGSGLRRGLIVIGGDAGDFTGAGMIAGSIFVFGRAGLRPGAGMKRGTIAFFGDQPALLPTFRFDCTYRPVFMSIYLNHLRSLGFPVPEGVTSSFFHRHSGDLVALGKGEVLVKDG